jgi:hypothetical protein
MRVDDTVSCRHPAHFFQVMDNMYMAQDIQGRWMMDSTMRCCQTLFRLHANGEPHVALLCRNLSTYRVALTLVMGCIIQAFFNSLPVLPGLLGPVMEQTG